MEIQDVCELYDISNKNGMYCLNDIAKRIVKMKMDDFAENVKDKKKIGKKYYVDSITFRKIVYSYENEECKNIINMLDGKADEKEEVKMLELQYKIECEKTKQMTISRDMKILDAKMEHLELARMRLEYGHHCDHHDADDSNSENSDSENSDTDSEDSELEKKQDSEKYEEVETLPVQQKKGSRSTDGHAYTNKKGKRHN